MIFLSILIGIILAFTILKLQIFLNAKKFKKMSTEKLYQLWCEVPSFTKISTQIYIELKRRKFWKRKNEEREIKANNLL